METLNWRKSVRCKDSFACVEAAGWRKPSLSFSNGNCVECGSCCTCGGVAVRDTKQDGQPSRDVLTFTGSAWRAFTGRVKAA